MKQRLAFVRNNLTRDNLRFARQCGVTHIVVHYTNYNPGTGRAARALPGRLGPDERQRAHLDL